MLSGARTLDKLQLLLRKYFADCKTTLWRFSEIWIPLLVWCRFSNKALNVDRPYTYLHIELYLIMVYLTMWLVSNELGSVQEEGDVTYFEVVSQHLVGRIQEKDEKVSGRIIGRRGCETSSYVHVVSDSVYLHHATNTYVQTYNTMLHNYYCIITVRLRRVLVDFTKTRLTEHHKPPSTHTRPNTI
jgi:hypothetical protein